MEQNLQRVHYEESTYVGECSKTIIIDGSVDDVMKILDATPSSKTINNIMVHVSPNVNVGEVAETIKSMMEEVNKHG